jgi:cyanamide hydratase family protein with HD domain
LLTCLLHDIGTTDTNTSATPMSFEFYGGMLALDLLAKQGAPKAQAESVAEAVFRHQDLGDAGTLTMVGALVQLATIFGEFVLSFYCYIFAISLGDSRQQETPGVIFPEEKRKNWFGRMCY